MLGLCLITNFNGSALSLANAVKGYKPLGVDYSRSFLATETYARLFGAGFLVVGGSIAVTSFLGLWET
ncbi:hypothetical protein IV498_00745 [Paenarthrobacter sp. Z7-10]|uniref:hypothetical protein n=1 Tax=Paenarthrobacter sp. Z7-10 TaxID=2787635 RepID=UPI0022A951A9|nr:hypothetical protein [Paenarthrobacter sp. Z7-10]MCZ2401746.1 hypothetical protein [Paenarthrobacter sp. Z7-10]